MAMTRDEKRDKVMDHVGALQSYLDALRVLARSLDDKRIGCAMDLLIEHAEGSRSEATNLFEELMEGRA